MRIDDLPGELLMWVLIVSELPALAAAPAQSAAPPAKK